jgi:hypothetical protein
MYPIVHTGFGQLDTASLGGAGHRGVGRQVEAEEGVESGALAGACLAEEDHREHLLGSDL